MMFSHKIPSQNMQEEQEIKAQKDFDLSINILMAELFKTIKLLKNENEENVFLNKVNQHIKKNSLLKTNMNPELDKAENLYDCAIIFYHSTRDFVDSAKFNQEQRQIILNGVRNANSFLLKLAVQQDAYSDLNNMRESVKQLITLHNEIIKTFPKNENNSSKLKIFSGGLSILIGAALVCASIALTSFNPVTGVSVGISGAGLITLGYQLITLGRKAPKAEIFATASNHAIEAASKILNPFQANPPENNNVKKSVRFSI